MTDAADLLIYTGSADGERSPGHEPAHVGSLSLGFDVQRS